MKCPGCGKRLKDEFDQCLTCAQALIDRAANRCVACGAVPDRNGVYDHRGDCAAWEATIEAAVERERAITQDGTTCPGCGASRVGCTYYHKGGCPAWAAVVGPYSTPNPPPKPGTVYPPKKLGWICPNCQAGIAPWMPYCSFCRPDRKEK